MLNALDSDSVDRFRYDGNNIIVATAVGNNDDDDDIQNVVRQHKIAFESNRSLSCKITTRKTDKNHGKNVMEKNWLMK